MAINNINFIYTKNVKLDKLYLFPFNYFKINLVGI